MGDPFGRALRDFHLDRLEGPLIQRDGSEEIHHPIEEFYFDTFDPDASDNQWVTSRVRGPLLDAGAGVGRHALAFQDEFETVALEVSEPLVKTMADRGVDETMLGDLFDLPSSVSEDRFETVLIIGTQATLATSQASLTSVLDDLAAITTADGQAIIDSYDPTFDEVADLLGYRDDPTPGIGFRVFHFEYDGTIGPTLLFRLFSPDVLADVAREAGWRLDSIDRPGESEMYFQAALVKP